MAPLRSTHAPLSFVSILTACCGTLLFGCSSDPLARSTPPPDAAVDANALRETGGQRDSSAAGIHGDSGSNRARDASADVPRPSLHDASPDAARADARSHAPCEVPSPEEGATVCLEFKPDPVVFGETEDIDGKGTLVIDVFDTEAPARDAIPIKRVVYPPHDNADSAGSVKVTDLPRVVIDGLPGRVYIRSLFVDNPLWFETGRLVWGMFVGGFDLNGGVRPLPPLREVSLVRGEGTGITQRLTVLRRLTTTVALKPGVIPADDGQGPLSVGVFQQASPLGAPIFGGTETSCSNLARGPVAITGFLYGLLIPAEGQTFYVGAQVDDFNVQAFTPPGAIVSLASIDAGAFIPSAQSITVRPDDYAVSVPLVELNFVLGGAAGLAPFACPVTVDGGVAPNAPLDAAVPFDGGSRGDASQPDGSPPSEAGARDALASPADVSAD